jgi:hypothetical protein
MEVKYHPLVQQDVLEAARKYHDISPRLAEEARRWRGPVMEAVADDLRDIVELLEKERG